MPLVDLNYSYPDDAPPSFGGVDLTPTEAPSTAPAFSDLAGASLRINSDIISPLTSETFGIDKETPEDGFDIGDELRGTPYENRMEFVGVRNRKAMDAVKVQLEQERRDRETIEAAGVLGTVMDFGSSMASWTLALPGGALVKGARGGYSAVRSAAMVGTAAGVAGAASEATLQASQVSRPMSETYTTIGASFLLGGVLGGVASQLTRGEWSDLVSRTDSAFRSTDAGYAGYASAGAATVERGSNRLKDEGLFKGKGLAAPMRLLNKQDPMIRLQTSELGEARTAVRDLAESPLELQANREGFATSDGGTVETRIKSA